MEISDYYLTHLYTVYESSFLFTVSPWQEAARLIFERGLKNGFVSHGFYSGNVFQMKGLGGLYMKYSICPSIFIYKPQLVNAGGLNMRVAYPMNFFPNKALVKHKPRGFWSGTYSILWLILLLQELPVLFAREDNSC